MGNHAIKEVPRSYMDTWSSLLPCNIVRLGEHDTDEPPASKGEWVCPQSVLSCSRTATEDKGSGDRIEGNPRRNNDGKKKKVEWGSENDELWNKGMKEKMRKQCVQIKTGECGKKPRKKGSLSQYNSGRRYKGRGIWRVKEERAKERKKQKQTTERGQGNKN